MSGGPGDRDTPPPALEELRGAMARGPVHFMGVGGAGMSALAEVLARAGTRVSGCDVRPGAAAQHLGSLGVEVKEGHDPAHVDGCALVVASAAVAPDHPELERARREGIPVVVRSRALGAWVSGGTVLAVAGTHGKTTTTALATEMLREAGMDPTGFVGGRVASWGSNLRAGGGEVVVVEADEYARSFLELAPRVAVITNVEADHLDVYGDMDAVREAFGSFLERLAPDGRAVVCVDDPGAARLMEAVGDRAYPYGLEPDARLRAVEVEGGPRGSRFRVLEDGEDRGTLEIPLPGEHNVRNALGAAAAARFLEAGWEAIGRALSGFEGVGRRFELLGSRAGVEVIDDYAHHPTEVAAALRSARLRMGEDGRLVAVFQPHLYTRTRDFHQAFGEALAAADVVWVSDVYPAREPALPGVTGELVARDAREAGGAQVHYHAEVDTLAEAVASSLRPMDLCITLGAGSIDQVGPAILERLEGSHA